MLCELLSVSDQASNTIAISRCAGFLLGVIIKLKLTYQNHRAAIAEIALGPGRPFNVD